MTESFLQDYCWGIVSLLAGLLVAQMLVVGTNLHLLNPKLDEPRMRIILHVTGRKWFLAFATLMAFGSVVYVAFPPFFQTALFHGAGRVLLLLAASFAIQVVALAVCHWSTAPLENGLFRVFLAISGFLSTFALGTFIGTFFTGTDFVVGGALETLKALAHPQALLLGLTLVVLTVLLGALYLLHGTEDSGIRREMYISLQRWFFPFVSLLVAWVVILLFRYGYTVEPDGTVTLERSKYFANFLAMPAVLGMLVAGIGLIVFGLVRGGFSQELDGFWFAAPGTVLLVMSVFLTAGLNHTPYYPSVSDIQRSLTVQNSCAGADTMQLLFWLSPAILLALIGLGYLWHRTDHRR